MKESFQDRNVTAAVCRSTPNGLTNLNSEINQCTTDAELNRNSNFATNAFKLQKDIESLTAAVQDSLIMGDTMFGQYGYQDIAGQVKDRNNELKGKKEILLKEVDKNEAIIERTDRDFSDVKDTVPEPQPKQTLRFIEDYTLAVLIISYLFMVMAGIYVYTIMAEKKLIALGQAVIASLLLSAFLFMLLYYIT